MSLISDLERLDELCSALSSQSGSLTSSMLANDEESISNLKTEISEAAEDLESGIAELKGYVSLMETYKSYWS